jgi:predicted helicase
MSDKKESKETMFKAKDVRLLRERLAWCYKVSPVSIQQQIHNTLTKFSENIKEYCLCEEKAFVSRENKWACLNCGKRYTQAEVDKK